METKYLRRDIKRITGLPDRRIQFYSDSGVLGELTSPGRGNERVYSRDDLFKFMIIAELRLYGIEISKIKKIFSRQSEQAEEFLKITGFFNSEYQNGRTNSYIVIYANGEVRFIPGVAGGWKGDEKTFNRFFEKISSAVVINLGVIARKMTGSVNK